MSLRLQSTLEIHAPQIHSLQDIKDGKRMRVAIISLGH